MARILIAEDEEALRALTARALTDSGHEVVTAVDGADALDILTREQGRFDLLLKVHGRRRQPRLEALYLVEDGDQLLSVGNGRHSDSK